MIGHFKDLSNEDYHSAPGTSKTQLDKIHTSPLEYWDTYRNPNPSIRQDESHFLFGSGMHSLILEPHLFEKEYAVGFDKSMHPDALDTMEQMRAELTARGLKTSGAKAELADRLILDGFSEDRIMINLEYAHLNAKCGKKIIPENDYRDIYEMLDAINRHHSASKLLKNCLPEHSYFVEDEYGMIRKCRPDFITANGQVCCDLKSTISVGPSEFGRSIVKFRYLVQSAWYMDVLKMHYGDDAPKVFAFIAIQKTRPYDTAVYYLTEQQVEIGRRAYQQDYALLRECLSTDYWPGCDGGKILEAVLPSWA